MRELRVGYVYDNYSVRRNVIGAAPYCRYVQIGDWYRALARAGRFVNRFASRPLLDVHDLAHQFRERRARHSVDLLHLFNQVSYGELPWISTFETLLPRLRSLLDGHHGPDPSFEEAAGAREVRRAVAALTRPNCRRLLAMSRCAVAIQTELLVASQRLAGRGSATPAPPGGSTAAIERCAETVGAKTTVLHPPQVPLLEDPATKPALQGRRLRLLFVGGSFFRKGGGELLDVLIPLVRGSQAALELTVVSPLTLDNGAAGESADDVRRVRSLFAEHRDWIRHYEHLDNAAVLELMRRADVGLLPTYADTYGFVVLEYQAAACPVISTDVRALAEINGERRGGWLIRVPKNRLGEALYTSAADRTRLSQAIRVGLAQAFAELLAAPESVRARGELALRSLRAEHDPRNVGERLFDLYMDCAAARSGAERASPSIRS